MRRLLIAFTAVVLLLPFAGGGSVVLVQSAQDPMTNRFAPSTVHFLEQLATHNSAAAATRAGDAAAAAAEPLEPKTDTVGCSDRTGSNVRVNQECTNTSRVDLLGRGQSQNETVVAVNPNDPNNVLFGQNDYRNGDGSCGFDYSFDGGKELGDGLLPESFTAPGFLAPRHYWDASGDPVVAFDSAGYRVLRVPAVQPRGHERPRR